MEFTKSPTIAARLLSRIRKAESGCWEWTGSTYPTGYGIIYVGYRDGLTAAGYRDQVFTSTHRASFELHVGPIPDGMHICHHCDNRLCCNPEHLFLGTHQDNMDDMAAKGRAQAGPSSDPAWWTEDRRAERGSVTKARRALERARNISFSGISPDSKFCPTCRRWLSRLSFGNNKARHDGLQAHCKACKSAANIIRIRRKKGQIAKPRRATRSDKKNFLESMT